MTALTKDESERLARIERTSQYGVTFKDLFWLVRTVRRLEKSVNLVTHEGSTKTPLMRQSAN